MSTKFAHPTTLSLFSGAGGLDIGFHRAGFRIVACVELEKTFCETLVINKPEFFDTSCQIINKDIRLLNPSEIDAPKIDFIIGGPPCQSFSAIGRRAGGANGINDTRGTLFEHYCRLVKHFQPSGFLFENVRGILSSNKGHDWELIISSFKDLGYYLFFRVLDAADYGVPQHRERLIMVGIKEGQFKFPRPLYGPDSREQTSYVTALQAISDLQPINEVFHSYSGKYGKLLEEVPPGKNYLHFTREMGYPNPVFAWRSRFSDFLYKADPDAPVRTIVAQLGKYSGPFHWKNRKFSVSEFKRLQTFPDKYQFSGGEGKALKQIGNSVPPELAYHLALSVQQQIFGCDQGLELLSDNIQLTYDQRKKVKATKTRAVRVSSNSFDTLPLFQIGNEIDSEVLKESINQRSVVFFEYSSYKNRKQVQRPKYNSEHQFYSFTNERINSECHIKVHRLSNEGTIDEPLISYTLRFNYPIGDGLSLITCTLYSQDGKDVTTAWDAIEDYISSISNYGSMLDVYGHFTEPHPIFELKATVLTAKPDFITRFAHFFSEFARNATILPSSVLEDLYACDQTTDFHLAHVVQELRALRWDVRVNQTNRTIPQGFFRCCYPFSIHSSKQVFVTWRESEVD